MGLSDFENTYRGAGGGIGGGPCTWSVRNAVSAEGYRMIPGAEDYAFATNESGRNFHTIDFMATRTHADVAMGFKNKTIRSTRAMTASAIYGQTRALR